MAKVQTWEAHREKTVKLLERRTGAGLAEWNARIAKLKPKSEAGLKAWLGKQGVEGYPQGLLVMERFGYPDFLSASADELVDGQYKGRPELRAIYDKVIDAAAKMEGVTIQARKTYVSLVAPRRTFARVQASKANVHVALRLEKAKAGGRLHPSKVHDTMPVELRLAAAKDFDKEAVAILRRAYEESA